MRTFIIQTATRCAASVVERRVRRNAAVWRASTYEGTFQLGRWKGIGMLVNPKGDVYAGTFEDNQYNGIGVMEFYLGARYASGHAMRALLLDG